MTYEARWSKESQKTTYEAKLTPYAFIESNILSQEIQVPPSAQHSKLLTRLDKLDCLTNWNDGPLMANY